MLLRHPFKRLGRQSNHHTTRSPMDDTGVFPRSFHRSSHSNGAARSPLMKRVGAEYWADNMVQTFKGGTVGMREIAGVLIALLLLSLTACGGEPKVEESEIPKTEVKKFPEENNISVELAGNIETALSESEHAY